LAPLSAEEAVSHHAGTIRSAILRVVGVVGIVAVAGEPRKDAMALWLSVVEADFLELVGMLVCRVD